MMANRILCVASILRNSIRNLTISNAAPIDQTRLAGAFLDSQSPLLATVRNTSFFNKLPAHALWKGCTTVSNAGKKRGRARQINSRNIRDLNRGQMIGVGKSNIVWPGLNAPVLRGREIVRQEQQREDPDWLTKIHSFRDAQNLRMRRAKVNPLERGWSGTSLPGRSIGQPDSIGDYEFNDFDTRVLQLKTVVCMKGNLGRARRQAAFVVVGNKKGMAGFGSGKSAEARPALRKAKNQAAQKLMHIPICDGHTVFHDFFCQFNDTKIFVKRKPEGHGLVCHRAIITICKLIGIKNLWAKVEGPTNVQTVTKAFFLGLMQQRNFQQLADEKGLHVVQLRKDRQYFPEVLASPTECRTDDQLDNNEVTDFNQHCLNGRVILRKPKREPYFTKHKSYNIYLKRQEKKRSFDTIKLDSFVRYGELRSFLTDKYPEARPHVHKPEE